MHVWSLVLGQAHHKHSVFAANVAVVIINISPEFYNKCEAGKIYYPHFSDAETDTHQREQLARNSQKVEMPDLENVPTQSQLATLLPTLNFTYFLPQLALLYEPDHFSDGTMEKFEAIGSRGSGRCTEELQ